MCLRVHGARRRFSVAQCCAALHIHSGQMQEAHLLQHQGQV